LEQRIKDRYNDAIKEEAMKRYGIREDQIQLLDGFESYMYEFVQNGREYILRIGHSLRRNAALINGEVDWINYLADGGASVSRAVVSEDGCLVEHIADGQDGQFLATAFEKAAGGPPTAEQWNDELFERYGQIIGRMHSLSKEYELSNAAWKRPEWDDKNMLDMESWLPPSEDLVYEKFQELYSYLTALPRDQDSYGLIHQDAHGGNFFVDTSGQITLFDFDDCAYSWYMNDIAIVLFYAAVNQEDPSGFTGDFMKQFLTGYIRENDVDPTWFEQIPHFLKLREIDLFAIIHRSFDVENIEDSWVASYMDGRKERIIGEVPFIDFDWNKLSTYSG